MLSFEFYEIDKNIFSERTPLVAPSVMGFAFEAGETVSSKQKWSYFNMNIFNY